MARTPGSGTQHRPVMLPDSSSSSSDESSDYQTQSGHKRQLRRSTRPRKHRVVETPTPPAEEQDITSAEADQLSPRLPSCNLDDCYTPDGVPETMKTYADSVRSLLNNPRLALPAGPLNAWRSDLDLFYEKRSAKTVIAVLGATGSGKSSMINALLGYPDLLPANCMRACTAAPVELSHHDKETFEADITFLTEDERFEEAETLRSILFNTEGRMRSEDADDDVAAAKAKFSARYPHVPLDTLREDSFMQLMEHPTHQEVLGTKKHISCITVGQFAEEIAIYIESKDGLLEYEDHAASPQLWPYIKFIECRLKSEVLATGAIIVDLPGTQDTNAARAAIANRYKDKADAFWIVAPINRAVNDKVAQQLVSEAFKTQLLMDGDYNDEKITVICTQTDRLVATEALRSLPYLRDDPEIQTLNRKLSELDMETKMNREALQKAKLKNSERPKSSNKAQQRVRSGQGNLTTTQEIADLDARISDTQNLARKYMQERDLICARARSIFAKDTIKAHFRTGLKQIEEIAPSSAALEEFAPCINEPDHSRMNIPVYCVSAHDYAIINGFRGSNMQPVIFTADLDTEIPQLREHVSHITWAGRDTVARRSIIRLRALAQKIRVYLSGDGKTCSESGEEFRHNLEKELVSLSKAWESVIDGKCSTLRKAMRNVVTPLVTSGADDAKGSAVETMQQFGQDYRWNTYRATMARKGEFHKDLNYLLVSPMVKGVASAWRRSFTIGVKTLFLDVPTTLMEKSNVAFQYIVDRAESALQERIKIISEQQRKVHEERFKSIVKSAADTINHLHRDISRQIKPEIQTQLSRAYTDAAKKRGPGCFDSMREIMDTEVAIQALQMFLYAAKRTTGRLDDIGEKVAATMVAECCSLKDDMRLAYSCIWENMTATVDQIQYRRAVRFRMRELEDVASRLLVIATQADAESRAQRERAKQS